ncbi:MAG: hypothetical protein NC548_47450 [Lachnospiraceae bacterium]|nr:hypothetical protein [Lachnospiraceae bacterium]
MDIISKDNIRKIRKFRYFRTDLDYTREYNNTWNRESYKNLLRLMTYAMLNNSTEVAILMRNQDFIYDIATDNSYDAVRLNNNMRNALLSVNDFTYTLFHNHPIDTSFSISDILSFLQYEKIDAIFVCTNNCKHIAVALKGDNHIKARHAIYGILDKAVNKLHIIRRDGSAFTLLKILSKFDIVTLYYENY